MNDRLASLVMLAYLLTYSDTKRALLGSSRRLRVNMSFSDRDRILIENLYMLKVMKEKTY